MLNLIIALLYPSGVIWGRNGFVMLYKLVFSFMSFLYIHFLFLSMRGMKISFSSIQFVRSIEISILVIQGVYERRFHVVN